VDRLAAALVLALIGQSAAQEQHKGDRGAALATGENATGGDVNRAVDRDKVSVEY
jgi:hypothetical protein